MYHFNKLLAATLLAASLGAAAHNGVDHAKTGPVKKEQKEWGIAGDAKAVQRTIAISMGDTMRFTPDHMEVKQGEVVKIVIQNTGQMLHEMVIGTKAELEEHAALMAKFPNMEHDEPYMAHVKPGAQGEIIWNFNRAGSFEFACLIAGHYQAGMKGTITVSGPNASPSAATVPAQTAAASVVASATSPAPATQDWSEGEVRKIDKENRKITLRHGEIKNLDMPAMTMVFVANDPALLDTLKPGDKIRFKAGNDAGKLTVTEVRPLN